MEKSDTYTLDTPTLLDTRLDTSDKIYLGLCSLILIGLLFNATVKKTVF